MSEDLTKNYDYDRLILEEKEHYLEIEVTDDLKEGGTHASSCWDYYWNHVAEVLVTSTYENLAEVMHRRFTEGQGPLRILSLGSGFCGHEIELARNLRVPYSIECTDINDEIFTQAREVAKADRLDLSFRVEDLNFIDIEPGRYHLIFSHAVIHHVINLERLFEGLVAGLTTGGLFHLVDSVGQNRKLIWDESERFANALLDLLPADIIGDHRLDVPFEADGMEGIRQEAILPLLRRHFEPIWEHRHGAFMRFVCTHAELSRRLDPSDSRARASLDFLIAADDLAVRHGVLKPLEIWGFYIPRAKTRRPD